MDSHGWVWSFVLLPLPGEGLVPTGPLALRNGAGLNPTCGLGPGLAELSLDQRNPDDLPSCDQEINAY